MEGNKVKRRFICGEIYSVTECLYSAKNDYVKREAGRRERMEISLWQSSFLEGPSDEVQY